MTERPYPTGPNETELRVLLVSGVYPPAIGGPSVQTRTLARELSSRGTVVRVLTQVEGADTDLDVDVAVLRAERARSPQNWAAARVALYRSVAHHLDVFRPTVVHVQTLGPIGIATLLAARSRRIPTLAKYAGSVVAEAARGGRGIALQEAGTTKGVRLRQAMAGWLAAVRERAAFRLASNVWVTTPTMAASLPIARSKVWEFPNFLDLSVFHDTYSRRTIEGSPTGATRLLTVARLKPHKGTHVAFEALALLPPRFMLTVVGDGDPDYERHLQDLASRLRVSDRVVFTGRATVDQVAARCGESDIFLLPSYVEAFGIALVEAAASGLPAVASRVGGVPDVVVDGQTGYLVPAGDEVALARAIDALDADVDLYASFSEAAYKRSVSYDLAAGTDALLRVYLQLLRRR